jgi:hypothetical protein
MVPNQTVYHSEPAESLRDKPDVIGNGNVLDKFRTLSDTSFANICDIRGELL